MKDIKIITMLVSVLMLGIRLVSLARDMMLASKFGATNTNDIFIMSQSIMAIFSGFIMQSFTSAYLPYASDVYCGKDKKKRFFFGSIYLHAFVLGIVQIIICYVFMSQIVDCIAPGFDTFSREKLYIAIMLQTPILLTQMINGVSDSNLQVIGKYSYVQLASAVPYVASLTYILIVKKCTLNGLVLSITVGHIIMLAIKMPLIKKYFSPKLGRTIWFENMKKMYIAVGLAMLTTAVRQINVIVDQSVSSLLGSGNMTLLSYAMKIPITETALVSTVLSTILYSEMAQNISKGKQEENESLIAESLVLIFTLIIPFMIFTIIFRKEIIEVLFQRGAFSSKDTLETSKLMVYYAFSMLGLAIQDAIVYTMFAYKIRKYSLITSIILVIVNTSIDLLTYKVIGNIGIALAYSISVSVIIPVLLYTCNKKILKINWEILQKYFLKCFVAAIIAGGIGWVGKVLFHHIFDSTFLILICAGVIACIAYIGISILFRNEILLDFFKKIKNRTL